MPTFEFDDLDGEVFFADTEDFKIAEDRLLGFGMTVDLDAEEVALVLPVEFTLRDRVRERGSKSNNLISSPLRH